MDVRVEDRRGEASCPYCRGPLETARAWTCPRCATSHHEECARENGRCTLLGCGAPVAPPQPPPEPRHAGERVGRSTRVPIDPEADNVRAFAAVFLLPLVLAAVLGYRSWTRPAPRPTPAPAPPWVSGVGLPGRDEAIGRIARRLLRIENEPERWTAADRSEFEAAAVDHAALAAAGVTDLEEEVRAAVLARCDGFVPPLVEANLARLAR